ncbi:Peptidoglycan D,D-transpeptidase MrdA [hydrothermal vent metagenome]|uniref:Peptidoglycan D,D-transpeptidase MrdA n=1 Tax=hydrothermal vent metagenome TaxID=652676 RepID=A0A3B0Z8I6_9ZZZZ
MRQAIKDHKKEARLFNSRVLLGLICVVILLSLLIGRMVHLQLDNHDHFTTLSEKNRVRLLPEPPIRGLIFDREGRILAENMPTYTLVIVPELVEDIENTIASLAEIVEISEYDINRFKKLRKRSRRFHSIPLRYRLSDEEVARLAVDRYQFPGVDVEARLMRHYPYDELSVHALGYVGRINERELAQLDQAQYAGTNYIGKTGIEKAYEKLLHGEVGYKQVETNSRGRILRMLEYVPPVPGDSIHLTLDMDMQRAAKVAMKGENGAVVALDPRNGQVLAMISTPEYNPNWFVNGIDTVRYNKLSQSQERPLFNRFLQGKYPPGSTLKPFTGLGAMELGLLDEHDHSNCHGWMTLPGGERRYRDWKKQGHGRTNMEKAIIESCDVYFYELAMKMSIDQMYNFLIQFGFNQRTGIDLGGESSGLTPSSEWKKRIKGERWYLGETLISSIGQGFNLTTPLQLAVATGTLAMAGKRMYPQLLLQTEDTLSGALQPQTIKQSHQVTVNNPENWAYMVESMVKVVNSPRGTAHKIHSKTFTIAGKTGTAQVFGIAQDAEYDADKIAKKLRDHALFIGFAPVDNPEIAIAVIVENGGSGGSVAAPVARAVMDVYFGKKP